MNPEVIGKYLNSQSERLLMTPNPFVIEDYEGENQVKVFEKLEDLEEIFHQGILVKISGIENSSPIYGGLWPRKQTKPEWEIDVSHHQDAQSKSQLRGLREFYKRKYYEKIFKSWRAEKRLEEIMQRLSFLHEMIHIYDEKAGDKVNKKQGSINERAIEVILNKPELEEQIWQTLSVNPNCRIELIGVGTPLAKYLSKILLPDKFVEITSISK